MNDNYTDTLELLDEAADSIREAIEVLRQVQAEVPALRHRMDAYLISTLEQALSDDNEWLGGSNSANIASLRVEVNELAARMLYGLALQIAGGQLAPEPVSPTPLPGA